MRLSLVIPAYNEEKVIKNTLLEYTKYFDSKKINYEILVIIEGEDMTQEIVKNLAKKNKRIKYKISKNRLGKGGAIVKGFGLAKGGIIGFVDADMATKPESFNELLKEIKDNDVVIASRNVAGSIIAKDRPLLQKMGSKGFNFLVRLILGLNIKDTQCGAKIFRKKVIKTILNSELVNESWAFDVELLYISKKNSFIIKEVPTIWTHRLEEAKFDFANKFHKIIPKMFKSLLKIRKLN